MHVPVALVHSGERQKLWQTPELTQIGPQIQPELKHGEINVERIFRTIAGIDPYHPGVLLNYSDPFLMRGNPLRGLREWNGPRLLACGDLHHGERPIETLRAYLEAEPHDAVLLTFNPAILNEVQQQLRIPVRSLPPSFFRNPTAHPSYMPRNELLHVGSLGPHHKKRQQIIKELCKRGQVRLRHETTRSPEEAASLYSQHALVLNIPLNNDLNHRFFEIMAAGVPQIVFGKPSIVGEHSYLADRPDVFWASTLVELETQVNLLLKNLKELREIRVDQPTYWDMKDLLKAALGP